MRWRFVFYKLNSILSSFVWGTPMLAAFLGTGAFLSFKARFYQIFGFRDWMSKTLLSAFRNKKENQKSDGSISQFAALSSALAACLGTGNIVGVATAISSGGAGSVFWMLFSAVLGMMTCCCENILAVKYKTKDRRGRPVGGPMYYIENGLGYSKSAKAYAFLLLGASLGMGNMTQANAVAESFAVFDVKPIFVAVPLAVVLSIAVAGGLKRISSIAEKLIPFLSAVFIGACFIVIFKNAGNLLPSLKLIFKEAFTVKAVSGYGMAKAVRYGVSRGVFSNEAGLGSNTIIHASANCKEPGIQGMWGILEVGIDTVFMCTVTAAAILSSGIWQANPSLTGVSLCSAVFESVFGSAGKWILSICTCLFAFATLMAWSYYGKCGSDYLFGERSSKYYNVIYIIAAFAGCILNLENVWSISDTLNGLMAIPNLIAILSLSDEAIELLNKVKNPPFSKKFKFNSKN